MAPSLHAHETLMARSDGIIDDGGQPHKFLYAIIDHEVFHTMFPFYLGTNETKYGWMTKAGRPLANGLLVLTIV